MTGQVNRTALEVVSDAFAAGIARDFDALLRLLADDVVLELPPGHPALDGAHSGIFRGKEEVGAALAMVNMKLRFQQVDLKRLIADDECAIGVIESTALDGQDNVILVRMTECWWVEAGKATKIRPYYFDTRTLAEQLL